MLIHNMWSDINYLNEVDLSYLIMKPNEALEEGHFWTSGLWDTLVRGHC